MSERNIPFCHFLFWELKNELPEKKEFSERNIGRMVAFYRACSILPQPVAKFVSHPSALTRIAYPQVSAIVPQPVAQLENVFKLPIVQPSVAQISWGHNIVLIEKIKDLPTRL